MAFESSKADSGFDAEVLGALMNQVVGTDSLDRQEIAAEEARLKEERLEPINEKIRQAELEVKHIEELVASVKTKLNKLHKEYHQAEFDFHAGEAKRAEEAKMLRLAKAAEAAALHIRRSFVSSAPSSFPKADPDDAGVVAQEATKVTLDAQIPAPHNVTDEVGGASIEFVIVNGVYSKPPCMHGVPVAKIVEGDTYWVQSWTKLEAWVAPRRSTTTMSINFFKGFEIHPNQLLNKEHYDSRGLCNDRYPIIIRRIMEVLEHANVANPVQWLRHRLAQLVATEKDRFDLKATLFSFQKHDLAYAKYYQKHRYSSISRPPRAGMVHLPFAVIGANKPKGASVFPIKKRARTSSPAPLDKYPCKKASISQPSLSLEDLQVSESPVPAKVGQPTSKTSLTDSSIISEGEDTFFELSVIMCGDAQWNMTSPGKTPFGMKYDATAKRLRPFSRKEDNLRMDKDLSFKFPELVISPHIVNQLVFRTIKEECDCVKLLRFPGTGLSIEFGFKKVGDARNFATLLCGLNNKIKLRNDHKAYIESDRLPMNLPVSSISSALGIGSTSV